MNFEQFKQIAIIIGDLGDKALSGLIAYFGLNFANEIVNAAIWIAAFYTLVKITKCVAEVVARSSQVYNAFCQIRDMLHIGSPGQITNSEIRGTLREVERLLHGNREDGS